VLVTQVREGNKLRGYSFCTLERIGGTPSLLVGLLLVDRNAKSDQTLKTILHDQFRRAYWRSRTRTCSWALPHVADGFAPSPASRTSYPRLGYKRRARTARGPTPGQALRF